MTPVNLDSKKEKKRKAPHLEKQSHSKEKSYMENLECCFLKRFPGEYFYFNSYQSFSATTKKHPKSQSQELLWKNKLSSSQTDWPQVCMEKSHHNGRCLHSLAKIRQWPKNRSTWGEQRQHNTSCLWIGATSPWCLNTWNVLSEGNVDCVTANEIHQSMLL